MCRSSARPPLPGRTTGKVREDHKDRKDRKDQAWSKDRNLSTDRSITMRHRPRSITVDLTIAHTGVVGAGAGAGSDDYCARLPLPNATSVTAAPAEIAANRIMRSRVR